MDKNVLNKSKLFEKIEIQWFSVTDIKQKIKEFRGFYQEIVLKLLSEVENIGKFIENKRKNKTMKNRMK